MDLLHRARRVVRLVGTGRWPRLELAAKAALSALVAWWLALSLPFGPAEQYPYYAPLGAVVASSTTVRTSVRESLSSVTAILAGAALALAASQVLDADLVLVPVVVGVGVLLVRLPVFGAQGSWVPIAALFVLVIGAQNPLTYVTAYAGLVLLGAAVAVVTTAVLPTVPLAQSDRAVAQLATALADQLDDLADGMLSDEPPTSAQWRERSQAIEPVLASVRAASTDVSRSLRANARARRERSSVEHQRSVVLVLDAVATRTEDLTDLVLDVRAVGEGGVDVGAPLRAPTAHALRAAAAAVRPLGAEPSPRPEAVAQLRRRVQELSRAAAAAPMPDLRGREMAGATTTALRRVLGALSSGLREGGDGGADEEAVTPSP